ncbi:MAG TPA: hypothetical protein VJC39_03725 [Candidatus Nanoarchaeia archaeon]|nr:hypothetical protein [Candidatus Nanoarchaeia archaeon]
MKNQTKPLTELGTGFKHGMKEFGKTINLVVNCVLLTLVYGIGVGLTATAAKLFKKQFLETKLQPTEKSYWSDLNLTKRPLKEYYRQF